MRGRHPDVIFLSEAFTRPKMMYRLAQGRLLAVLHLLHLAQHQGGADRLPARAHDDRGRRVSIRPNFFVNTPDINPVFLQTSGRAGFLIRAALAATLSGLWGIYTGFEICEAAPLPGREEYLDSEKYEIRLRDLDRPGNIVAEIAALNRIRKRASGAAQPSRRHLLQRLQRPGAWSTARRRRDRDDMILVAVNLDPHQRAGSRASRCRCGSGSCPTTAPLDVEDLMRGQRFVWHGKVQHLRLDPAAACLFAHLALIAPQGGRP